MLDISAYTGKKLAVALLDDNVMYATISTSTGKTCRTATILEDEVDPKAKTPATYRV